MKRREMNLSDYLTAFAVLFSAIGLLTRSDEVSKGIAAGIETCVGILIPALFPFMALSGFLSVTSAGRILSIPLRPVTTKIFKLPEELGAIVLLSLIGGYPVGAKNVSQLIRSGKISPKTAERMMCFCMNPGPSFLITAVGVQMLNDETAGMILFFTQTAATVVIGAAASFRAEAERERAGTQEMRGVEAFVEAVSKASSAMLAMCAFVVIFSGLLPLVRSSAAVSFIAGLFPAQKTMVSAAISGIFEVTAGCVGAAHSGGAVSFGLISVLVSFGGLSILFQVMSCFRGIKISFKPLLISRALHALIAALAAVPLYHFFCASRAVFAPVKPVVHADMRSIFIAASLLCMCALLTVSAQKR